MQKMLYPNRKCDKELVLLRSGRVCGFCYGLHKDAGVKAGQIAHLDQDYQNGYIDNLMFMCLAHRDEYDSTSSHAVGLTIDEAKEYRNRVEALNAGEEIALTKRKARPLIYDNCDCLIYLAQQEGRLAVHHHLNFKEDLLGFATQARLLYESCCHKGVRMVYGRLSNNLNALLNLLNTDEYLVTPLRRKFDNKERHGVNVHTILREKMASAETYTRAINREYKRLQKFSLDQIHIDNEGKIHKMDRLAIEEDGEAASKFIYRIPN